MRHSVTCVYYVIQNNQLSKGEGITLVLDVAYVEKTEVA
jgi:hypothetical protein